MVLLAQEDVALLDQEDVVMIKSWYSACELPAMV